MIVNCYQVVASYQWASSKLDFGAFEEEKYIFASQLYVVFDDVAARPMGGSSDDGDEAGTDESRQPLCQHGTR